MPDTKYEFPDAFLEAGSDDNHTYASMKTTRQADGGLQIDVVGWGVAEYGLYLDVTTNMNSLELGIMGFCGTVPRRTFTKVTFSHVVDKETENQLHQIDYRRLASVGAGQIVTHFLLRKLPVASSQ